MKKKRWITNAILIVCILVFAGSGLYLLKYYMAARGTENDLEELIELKEESEIEETEETETVQGRNILKKYKKLYKKNSDFIGWIQVKGTEIDYPVMQTKEEPEFYLHKNFKKEYDVNGLPFFGCKV